MFFLKKPSLVAPLLLLQEKWFDEDPEKISVLEFVATFKDRLFRAGQVAKRNLQESQSKMEVWYDRKTKSRCFEPGDKVLVFFPIVGNPLQSKYSGPYKVVKKISDTNYLVRIPGRRKETDIRKQKCVISLCSKHIMKNQNQNYWHLITNTDFE